MSEVVRSPFPTREYSFNTRFGIQKICVNCNELGINKEIKVFTLIKNNVDIELVNDLNDENFILTRKSWFRLKYE